MATGRRSAGKAALASGNLSQEVPVGSSRPATDAAARS